MGGCGSIHIVLQSKGGVGKSFVAAHIAQYFAQQGSRVHVFDSDPTTPTLTRYGALGATYFNFMDGDELDVTKFDDLATSILGAHEDVVVVDTGSSNFIPMASYLRNEGVLRVFADEGRRVSIHSVLVGGPAARETLAGLVSIVRGLFAHDYVAWLNSFFGPIAFDGKPLEETPGYAEVRDKLRGIVRIKHRSGSNNVLHAAAVRKMLERYLTYGEVFESRDFSLWEKQRLREGQREIYDQLGHVFPGSRAQTALAGAT
jgi:hypothetical protein